MQNAFLEAGFSNAYDHYDQHGFQENINPSNNLDTSSYISTKSVQCGFNENEVFNAFVTSSLNPISHFVLHGQYEQGITLIGVSAEEAVLADSPV